MNLTVDEITKSITGKLSLQDCDPEELRQITQQYPFFGPARFLLARRLKQDLSPQLDEHIQRASLYFLNPVWFDHVLNDAVIMENMESAVENPAFPPLVDEVPVRTEDLAIVSPHVEDDDDEDDFIDDPPTDTPGDEQPLKFPEFKFQPAEPADSVLSFEPYHTVDYFASQGIQVKEEEKPKDQFDRQLKSFTEWLKVLRKVPATEIASSVSPQDERNVEKMAAVSIDDREVVTETMAEVWEKQGNKEKARAVYHKLSLLNPSKSSYFAAKIEQLKSL